MSENVGYYYIAPDTMGELESMSELKDGDDRYGEEFQNKLQALVSDSGFDKELNIIWFDLAQFFSDKYEQFFSNSADGKYRPCIFIGSQSIEILQKSNFLLHKKISQLDNNIWTYYINIQEKDAFDSEFKNIINAIKLNYSNNLYNSTVGIEYLKFFIRICENNYLEGGHSSQVLPFVFTSKTWIYKDSIKRNLETIVLKTKDINKVLTLKVLLIDDYGNKDLRLESNLKTNSYNKKDIDKLDNTQSFSKGVILKKVFKSFKKYYKKEEGEDINIDIHIDVLESPNINAITSQYYDIYLLDYNFNNNTSGLDLLKDIVENNNVQGPFGKPWVIPISSFTNAMVDEMRNMRIHFVDPHYELSRGADFINTPFLFLHYFTKMITNIIEKAFIIIDNINKIQTKIGKVKHWNDLQKIDINFVERFSDHINEKHDVKTFLDTQDGLLKSLSENFDKEQLKKQINYYEQLLYNLAYRNYEGNEEIIIFHDLLKQELKQ